MNSSKEKLRYVDNLHPALIMSFFIAVFILSFTLLRIEILLGSLLGASLYFIHLRGFNAYRRRLFFILPMFLLIVIANPLFNHRGVTPLFIVMDQWITLEAILYGVSSGLRLASIILWFACYQEVMSSDKFLYLFGKLAPATSLLITLTMAMIPRLQSHAKEIQESQALLYDVKPTFFSKLQHATRNLSALLSMSMENGVETADSMRARGFGEKRRTTFHLFKWSSRDSWMAGILALALAGVVYGLYWGFGKVVFYPSVQALPFVGGGEWFFVILSIVWLLLFILEKKEELLWRYYGLMD